jgi:enamine deaminase RidA (YjgF/YER057c/UK114 family)
MPKRPNIKLENLQHENPIPVACVIGRMLVTSGIFGKNPDTGGIPPEIEMQCRNMFENIQRILTAANGTTDDIIKMTVWVKDKSIKNHVNVEWLKMFPDEDSRPVRHSITYQDLPAPALVQCEIMAILGKG